MNATPSSTEVPSHADICRPPGPDIAATLNLAIVCNSIPPYRLHLHERIAREMPHVRLWTVRTHEEDGRWSLEMPPEIGFISFSDGIVCSEQGRLRYTLKEWRKGGRIIRWMNEQHIGAVILSGYNDVGRVRILQWCKARGVPCYISGDSNILDEHLGTAKAWIKNLILPKILGLASGAMPFGSRGKEYFEKYGVRPERIFFLPYEPDVDLIRDLSAAQIDEVKAKYGLRTGRNRLLFCGRLIPCKRVDQLIDAFASIAHHRPNWDLVILGDGPLGVDLKKRVPSQIARRVIWAGHVSEPAVVAAFYRACDVLVLPSEQERWALVIHEAAAAGMALVSSSIPGAAADLIRDGVNGRVFRPGDESVLKDCLMDVTQPGRLETMKEASPRIVEEWREWANPIKGLAKALHAVGVS